MPTNISSSNKDTITFGVPVTLSDSVITEKDLSIKNLVCSSDENSISSQKFSNLLQRIDYSLGKPKSINFNSFVYPSNKDEDLKARVDLWTNATTDITYENNYIENVNVEYKEIVKSGDLLPKTGSSGEFVKIGELFDGSNVALPLINIEGNISGYTDGTSLIKLANPTTTFTNHNTLFMVTQFEYNTNSAYTSGAFSPINIITLKQNKKSGELTAVSAHNLNTTGVNGMYFTCASSITPWNTILSSEEYPPNTWAWQCYLRGVGGNLNDPSGNQYAEYGGDSNFPGYLNLIKNMYNLPIPGSITIPSPYRYGYIPEVTVLPNGTGTITKHYCMGRFSHEAAVVMPDRRTVLFGNDSNTGCFFMFIADVAGNLTSGKLYAAKLTQIGTGATSSSWTVKWILMGHGTDSEIFNFIDTTLPEELYNIQARDSTGGYTLNGTYYPKTADGYIKSRILNELTMAQHQLYMKYIGTTPEHFKKFAFLESVRCAEWLGATCEASKMEGVDVNIKDKVAYYAMSSRGANIIVDGNGELDEMKISTSESSNGYVFKALLGDNKVTIQGSSRNTGFVEEAIDSAWVPYELSSISQLAGSSASGHYLGDTSVDNKVANPDNVKFSEKLRTLFIGEDSGKRTNNRLWAFNVDTNVSRCIMSTPFGSESTGLGIYDDINGFSYCTTSFQHMGTPSSLASSYFGSTEISNAFINRWGSNYRNITSIGYISSLPCLSTNSTGTQVVTKQIQFTDSSATVQILDGDKLKGLLSGSIGGGGGSNTPQQIIPSPLVIDPSLPTFEELERSNATYYGNLYHQNQVVSTPDYYSKRISHKNRSIDVRWPEHTYKFFDINHFEDVFKNLFAWCDKFLPEYKVYPAYAHHNIKDREPFIFDVTNDASGVSCVANNDIVIGAEWYSCGFNKDELGTIDVNWLMLFSFKYSDTGASENFMGIPTHIRVITPRKNPSAVANLSPLSNGCVFINYIPLTTNATTHASNVTSNINSALWYDGVLSINAQIYDNVEHTTTFTNILNTTTRKKVVIDFNAVNFFKSPSLTNVYKAYSLTPEAFIQKGNAIIQNWSNGTVSDTITDRDSSGSMYDGLVAMTYNVGQDMVIKLSNNNEKYNWNAYAQLDQYITVPKATAMPNMYIHFEMLPVIPNLNSNGKIDMNTYTRSSTMIAIHEYTHVLQQSNTWHYTKDIEAQATYFEQQPGVNYMKDILGYYRQQYFKDYTKNCVSNTKSFLGLLTKYDYQFSLFYLYMSKYDTVDSEFGKNPRFFAEVMKLLANRTYSSVDSSGELNSTIYGIGSSSDGATLIDTSGELSQFDIYNGAYKALKNDSSANILASEYDNIVMASILNISQTEAETTYSSCHPGISNWAYPDFMNFKAYKAEGIREMEAKGELKPMVRTIFSQAVKDAPKLSKYSPEYLVTSSYAELLNIAENVPITTARTKGSTSTKYLDLPNIALDIKIEPFSSLTVNALASSRTIISPVALIIRTVYFPSEGNLTIQDFSPVNTLDESGNNVFTYTVNSSSNDTVIAIINNTPYSSDLSLPGVLPSEYLVLGTRLWLLTDIEYGTIYQWFGIAADSYTEITSNMVVVGRPTTDLTDMLTLDSSGNASGMKKGYYADYFDASGVSCVTGKIAICRRGTLGFGIKANNAWLAGAKGLIIVDNSEVSESLMMTSTVDDIAMNIPVWRIRPSWYHTNIAPYLVASDDGRYATTSFIANWALNYQYQIPINPAGIPPQLFNESHDYTIADVTDVTDGDACEM